MSWSVSAIGKAASVKAKAAEQFAAIKCNEPEETIKNKLAEAVDLALTDVDGVIEIKASGSQYTNGGKVIYNNFAITLNQIYGFIE